MAEAAPAGTYIQYGCGGSCPAGWANFDASPSLSLQRLPVVGSFFKRGPLVFPDGVEVGDIVKGLPVPPNSADGVYASHVLEHLSLADIGIALRNTLAILKPGGTFRLIVPDLEGRARRYLEATGSGDSGAHSRFMRVTHLGVEQRPRGLAGIVRSIWGNSSHLWMWDERGMRAALEQAGFVDIRRCRFNDSPDPAFRAVENPGRFHNEREDVEECAMEARKPG